MLLNLDEKFEVIRIDNDIHFVDLSGNNKVELVDNDGSLSHKIESNKKREKIVFKCNGSCCFFSQITDTHLAVFAQMLETLQYLQVKIEMLQLKEEGDSTKESSLVNDNRVHNL